MGNYTFQLEAALPPKSALYVTRKAETQAIATLRSDSPSFLLLTEPRQQGKTSFLNYLFGYAGLTHCCFLLINAGPVGKNTTEADWYRLISSEAVRQLARYDFQSEASSVCTTREQWREQLICLGEAALVQNRLIVIMIDELGHLPPSWRESFFASICAVRDERSFMPPFNAITFVFAGSFRPEAMITDGNISPFNKARPLELGDFTSAQVRDLLQHAGVSDELAEIILPRLFYWTDGQPYLVQQLAAMLLEDESVILDMNTIDTVAHRIERTEKLLLPPIFSRVRTNRRWIKQAERILNGGESEFAPSSLLWQAELATLGLIKEEKSTARCVIRNPIFARALRRLILEEADGSDVPDNRDEIRQHLQQLINEHERRKKKLELTSTRYGFNVSPEVVLEIEDIDKQIAQLTEQIAVLQR